MSIGAKKHTGKCC